MRAREHKLVSELRLLQNQLQDAGTAIKQQE